MSSTAPLACPNCGAAMRQVSQGAVPVVMCTGCNGVWLEDGEFAKVTGRDLPALGAVASLELGEATRQCPRCGIGLAERRVRDDAALLVDLCSKCKGLFLDAGELQSLQRLAAASRPPAPSDRGAFREQGRVPAAPSAGVRYRAQSEESRREWSGESNLFRELDGGDGWLAYLFNLPVEENRTPSIPMGNVILLLFLAASWGGQIGSVGLDRSIDLYGLVPADVLAGRRVHTVLSSAFVHGSWAHVLGNLYFLFLFGPNVERRLGLLLFLSMYVIGGLAASVLTLAMNASSDIPHVGASGAIAAVMGASLILHPGKRILQPIFRWFLRVWAIALPAWLYMMGWLALNLFGAYVGAPGIAWWAHLGGFGLGAAAGVLTRATTKE